MALRTIAERLGVSKSSVSLWVRDIALTPEQDAALLAKNPVRNGQLLGMRVHRERCREQRIAAGGLLGEPSKSDTLDPAADDESACDAHREERLIICGR